MDNFELPLAIYGSIYAIWSITVAIIDIMVCSIIFYRACDGYCWAHQLYSLDGIDYTMSQWLQVYGATSVTKFAVWPSLSVNPFLIIIIGSYLYVSSTNINDSFEKQCPAQNQTVSCQIYNNPAQYKQLVLLNSIQLFGSAIVLGIIPATIIIGFIVIYLRDISSRIHKKFCCNCYKSFCNNCSYIFCYGDISDKDIPYAIEYV